MKKFDVVIVGDGLCSLLSAFHVRRGAPEVNIAVIGKSRDWGPGLAYGRCHTQHLLNVPARRMSAFPEDPEHFLRWLTANIGADVLKSFETSERPLATAFVPRRFYGQYLRSIAAEILPGVTYLTEEIESVEFKRGIFSVSCGSQNFSCGYLILAPGVAVQPDKKTLDPWETDFSRFKDSTKTVVILGTGLTMVDVISSLSLQNFKGKIMAVSRRGLLPEAHAPRDEVEKIEKFESQFKPFTGTLAQKMKIFRGNANICIKAGVPWQAYIDYMRPHMPELWRELTLQDQKKFLARVFPYWNVHRHRQPPETAALLKSLIQAGQLEVVKGVAEIPQNAKVFNCRGADYLMKGQNFLQKIIAKDLLQPNENGLGVKVDEGLSALGKAQGRLFVLGALTAGTFLEATGAPELRQQCVKVADAVISRGFRTDAAASGTGSGN